MKRTRYWLGTLALALMAAGLTYVLTWNFVVTKQVNDAVDQAVARAVEETKKTYEPYINYQGVGEKVVEVGSVIDQFFVGDYEVEDMEDAVAAAMVEATGDEWSYYISADELATYYENLTNSYVGIGVTVTVSEELGGLEVTDVTRDSPAYQAGIQEKDVIIKVEGDDALELGLEAARDRIRGEEGTAVTITIRRDGEEFDVTMTRSSILTEVVTYEMLPDNIGFITIANFDQRCAEQTMFAISQLRQQGAEALIFDVRFNPGGMKTELCVLLDYLLPEGIIFQSRETSGEEEIVRSARGCLEMPMAVLVNIDSYSAAEFFAAALQEYEWATIVGEKTYGKGYYQRTYQLSDGSAIALSSGAYFTPKGVSLAGEGITPDIEIDMDDETYAELYYGLLEQEDDPQLQAAIEALLEQIGANIDE